MPKTRKKKDKNGKSTTAPPPRQRILCSQILRRLGCPLCILNIREDEEVVEELIDLGAGLVDGAHDGGAVLAGEPQQEGDHEIRRLRNGADVT